MKRAVVAVAALALVAVPSALRRRPSRRPRRPAEPSLRRLVRVCRHRDRRRIARRQRPHRERRRAVHPGRRRRSSSGRSRTASATSPCRRRSPAFLPPASRGSAEQPSRCRAPASPPAGRSPSRPGRGRSWVSRDRRGSQGIRAGVPPPRRAFPVRRIAFRPRSPRRCLPFSASASWPVARSCSRLRCGASGPLRVERCASTSASAPSGSCASRRRATPKTAGARRAWHLASSVSPSWRGPRRA